jgi:uncharacterized membrane protein SpoIIM required for sporulation
MFIKRNAGKWKKYQHEPARTAEETAERFTVLIDDLSYAKTFYPRSKVTIWINGITASIYQNIYRNKKEKYSRIFYFWKYELPFLFRKYHRIFLFTACLFIITVLLGYFASKENPDFVRGILGDSYVDMTEENISKGDPFGVYRTDNPFSMFMTIAFNNIRVAFVAFLGGLPAGLGTFYILWENGIILGSFHQIFFSSGLGVESVLVIWIHGTIEICSIVIAGTAGFILANGMLFPGTYSRMRSFKSAARDAVKIMITLIPFFIIAAFFESYITHLMSETYSKGSTEGLPVWVSLLVLSFSLFLIIWYFVIWPVKLAKRGIVQSNSGYLERIKMKNA